MIAALDGTRRQTLQKNTPFLNENESLSSSSSLSLSYSCTSLFGTRLSRTPRYFELKPISLQVFFSHLLPAISNPRYLELFFFPREGLKYGVTSDLQNSLHRNILEEDTHCNRQERERPGCKHLEDLQLLPYSRRTVLWVVY